MEKEIDNKLSYLDVFLDNSSTSLKTSVFRKKTFTGFLLSSPKKYVSSLSH